LSGVVHGSGGIFHQQHGGATPESIGALVPEL